MSSGAIPRPRRWGRDVCIVAALMLCLAIAVAASLLIGSGDLTLGDALRALRGQADPTTETIVFGLRLPRTVIGLTVGAVLGMAGGLTQLHTRNPLADPGLLGATSGAGFGVVFALAVFGLSEPEAYLWFALIGALAAGAVVLVCTARITAFEPMTTLVLTGAILSALLGSATTAVELLNPEVLKAFRHFSVGSLVDRPLSVLAAAAPFLMAGSLLTLINVPAWPSLQLGDELAASLGRPVRLDRLVGLGAVVLLAAGATAVAGSIGFLGLLAPHAAARLFPAAPVATVLISAPVGALLLLGADVAGRVMMPTGEVSVGIMLAVIGAPLFVILARKVTQ